MKYLMIAALAFVFIDVYTTKGFSGELENRLILLFYKIYCCAIF